VRLYWSVDAAGGMFGPAPLIVIEGLSEIVEVLFRPGRFQLPLVGPAHPVPAIARVRRQLGH